MKVLIDWFTVIAQIVNLLVLVVLLKVFLFDRIVEAMDARAERISARLKEAENREQEADRRARKLQQELDELEQTREDRLAAVKEEVEARRDDLLAAARQHIENQRNQWRQATLEEKDRFLDDLHRRSLDKLRDALRMALEDLADARLQDQIVRRFVTRLQDVDTQTREAMREAVHSGPGANRLTIASAFDLDQDQRDRLLDAVEDALGVRPDGGVDTDHDLICGIECRAGGMTLGWNLETWLDTLTHEMNRVLETRLGEGDTPEEKDESNNTDASSDGVDEGDTPEEKGGSNTDAPSDGGQADTPDETGADTRQGNA